ncbi:MAG: hypothetical protein VXZ84_01760, partial [Planctomycetota bacterium]|nr:hypothetical protein [Planctomycetota bacterium]
MTHNGSRDWLGQCLSGAYCGRLEDRPDRACDRRDRPEFKEKITEQKIRGGLSDVTSEEEEQTMDDRSDQGAEEDHWGGLASELGAETVSPTSGSEQPTAADDLPVAFDAVPSTAKMPEASGGDWGGLLETLGVAGSDSGEVSSEEADRNEEETQNKPAGRSRRRRGKRGGRGRRRGQTAEAESASEAVVEGAEIAALGADVEAIESVVEFTVEVDSI